MAENSKIEWCDHTFNPWIGCQKVGPGCDHCYAEAWDARGLQGHEQRWGAHADRTRTSAANWRKPLAWNGAAMAAGKRARVFCASLADVFDNHSSIQDEWRQDLWRLIHATPNLDWLLLTKRPGNIRGFLPNYGDVQPNVWLGCTVVNQVEFDRDVKKLWSIPAKHHFLSIEPMLGPIFLDFAFMPYGAIDWIICGGESGKAARPMHPDWARSLRDQCVAAGVPFLFKQWGEFSPDEVGPEDLRSGRLPPGHVDFLKVGKKAAGRLLEGRTWDEVPA